MTTIKEHYLNCLKLAMEMKKQMNKVESIAESLYNRSLAKERMYDKAQERFSLYEAFCPTNSIYLK